LFGLGGSNTFAQKPADVVGDWSGVLQPSGGSLRLALHVSKDAAGKLSVTLDSLDQNAMGLQGSNAVLNGNDFSFAIPSVSGTYNGTLASDGKSISGTWSQGGPLPLVFTRQRPAQPKDVVGDWSGALQAGGGSLRLALHVSRDAAGKLSVTLDSLDQNAMGLQGSNAVLKGNSFSFEIPTVSGTYTGTLDSDGKSISGTGAKAFRCRCYSLAKLVDLRQLRCRLQRRRPRCLPLRWKISNRSWIASWLPSSNMDCSASRAAVDW